MKNIITFLFINFLLLFISNKAISKIVILDCHWNDSPERIMNLHIDTVKQHLIQFDTTKYDQPVLALTNETRFFIAIEIILTPTQSNEVNKQYNDTETYGVQMFYWDINRYSGRFQMHTQTMTKKKFVNKNLTKMRKLKGSGNIYNEILKFAENNDGLGYRLSDDFGPGTCKKSNKKF
ncbi:hypothetical protein N9T28_01240 [Candidatus Pelagibacter sp.]|nr:hypothetical protein [Candidatus Pelagibacter sp.]